jgi:hypothetical protein
MSPELKVAGIDATVLGSGNQYLVYLFSEILNHGVTPARTRKQACGPRRQD